MKSVWLRSGAERLIKGALGREWFRLATHGARWYAWIRRGAPEAVALHGRVAMLAGEEEKAEGILSEGLKAHEGSLPLGEELAFLYLFRQRYAEAWDLASDLARRYPDAPQPLIQLAMVRRAEGDLPAARRYLKEAERRTDPTTDTEALVGLAAEVLNLADGRGWARRILWRAVLASSEDWRVYCLLGLLTEDREEARRLLEEARKLWPGSHGRFKGEVELLREALAPTLAPGSRTGGAGLSGCARVANRSVGGPRRTPYDP